MTSSSFYVDGETYDTAVVTSNDNPASTTPSQAPSSFFVTGGVVGEGTVVSNETGPGPQSNTPSSFFTDGAVVTTETVESNDAVPSTSPSQAPSSFYPAGTLYDFLSQESEVVALLQQLAATTTTNASSASSSASQAGTYASQAQTSAANAAGAVQDAAGTDTPLMDGTAAVGTSPRWAHEDHVHPKDPSLASVSYVDTKVAAVVNSAPATLDTLNELATALGDDPNFATTTATALGNRVRVDAAQSLTAAQQDQARSNIGIIQTRSLANGTDFNTLTTAGTYVANVATVVNYPVGINTDQYFYITVEAFGATGYTKQTAFGANSGRMFTRVQAGGSWTPWRRLVSDDIGPVGQCRLVYTNATTLTLKPWNGNNIKINGHIYQIPAAGITVSNSGAHASTLEFIYAQVDGSGNVSLTIGEGGHGPSSTAGNVGVETYLGNDALSLVGMAYMNASGQFVDNAANRWVRSWFNDPGVELYNNDSSSVTVVYGTSWTELVAAVRCFGLLWAGESYNQTCTAMSSSNGAGTAFYLVCLLNGGVSGSYMAGHASTAGWYQTVTANVGNVVGGDGLYNFSMAGLANASGAQSYYSVKAISVLTNGRN